MSNLVVIVYPDERRAAEVAETLRNLHRSKAITVEDVCYVTRDENGQLKLHQGVELAKDGALGGLF